MQPLQQDTWHLARSGQTYGPYTWEQVVEHARGGRIGRGDKLFDPRTGAWAKPSEVPGLFGPGGAAGLPVGLSVAAKIAVGVIITLALLVASFFVIKSQSPRNTWEANTGIAIVQQADNVSSTSPTVVMGPEGLTFKGTFRWESEEAGGSPNSWQEGTCYLWIYTTDSGTMGRFAFEVDRGGYMAYDWYPVYLVTHTGSQYVLESSERSLVERMRVVVDVTDTGMSGTVRQIEPRVISFLGGTFTGESISYEQYVAEAP